MADKGVVTPIGDSIAKVDNEIAVGEDLDFQRRWWRFERIIWALFLVIILCDLVGLFGRGWLSKASAATADGALTVDYERVERANTPSTMTLRFGPAAIARGEVQVFLSDSVIQDLGTQRIAPQPAMSTVGQGGIRYRFAATTDPAAVQIQLQPASPGLYPFRVQLHGHAPIAARVLVLP